MTSNDRDTPAHETSTHLLISRRSALRGAAVLGASTALAIAAGGGDADATTLPYDPQQRFLRLVGGGDGQIFAIQADGALLWYRHLGWNTATRGFASGSGRKIGGGWHQFKTVMGSVDGSLYALHGDGSLWHYRYTTANLTTGAGSWSAAKLIATGFDTYPRVFGFDGAVYGVDASGDLFWHQYDATTGRWTSYGQQLTGNFISATTMAADVGGVLYVYQQGNLAWRQHGPDGSWSAGSGIVIGTGFDELAIHGLYFLGQGSVYAVQPTLPTAAAVGELLELRLTNYADASAGAAWANNRIPTRIASGWTMESQAALQGYATTRSVYQGQNVSIAVSSTFASYSWSVVQVGAGPQPVLVRAPVTRTGGLQHLPVGFFINGCGWTPKITFTVPRTWRPGLYAVRLEGPNGLRRDVPFIVKPVAVQNQIAVLLPTNTYNAYNTWGGHSQYCHDLYGVRYMTLDRPSTQHAIEATGRVDHTMWSDVMLLQWLSGQGLAADCYSDADLHQSGGLLNDYKVLVLASHPEYWTDQMRQQVLNFLAGGGRVIYSGGNGIYARVHYNTTQRTVISGFPTGGRELFSELGLPASQLLGVNYGGAGYGTFAPYVVTADHPILAGTGLTVGSTFGETGYNGAASGWEMDGFLGVVGEVSPAHVIAKGANSPSGAQLVLRETSAGGFVFSASSIAFNGALASDPAMSTLFRNVFTKALAAPAPRPTVSVPTRVAGVPAQPEPAPAN